MRKLKSAVRDVVRLLGYDVQRFLPHKQPLAYLAASLKHFNVDMVLDVGGNIGQFGLRLRDAGYAGRIVSFEPLEDEHRTLSEVASRDELWTVHKRTAIGDKDGYTTINVAGNSSSSSILPMLDTHKDAAPSSEYVGVQEVPVARLDRVACDYLQHASRTFLKLDAQGYEARILEGASDTLVSCKGVLCEMSVVPLYEGQTLWQDMIARLEDSGFRVWSIDRGFSDPASGRALQLDVTLFRV